VQHQTGSIATGERGQYKRPGIEVVGHVDMGIYVYVCMCSIYVCVVARADDKIESNPGD